MGFSMHVVDAVHDVRCRCYSLEHLKGMNGLLFRARLLKNQPQGGGGMFHVLFVMSVAGIYRQ